MNAEGQAGRDAEQTSESLESRGVRMRAAALLLAGSALLSLVLGYARDMALANQVGAGREADAYSAAFMLPDFLNYLLAGGALSIAFMPLYNRTRLERGEAAGDRLFATTFGTLGAIVLAATAILWIFADALVALQFSGFSDETRALTVHLTRIVLPAQIFFVAGGLMRSVLMANGSFSAQAAAPIFYNGFIIAAGLATGSVEGFAWGVLAGAFVGNLLFPLEQVRRLGKLRLRVAPFDTDFRAYLWLALPLMLGLGLTTVDEWYEKWFGAQLEEGSVAALTYARKLMRAPVTVVGQAVAVAALPTLSLMWSQGRADDLNRTLDRTLRESLGVAVLAGGALFLLAPQIVDLLYHHGRFTADDALHVTGILRVLVFAVPGFVLQQIAVRAFYARADMWRPMLLGTGLALAAVPFYLSMAGLAGTLGLAFAGAAAISANALATLLWARRRHGAPRLAGLGATALRASVVTAAAAAAASFVPPLEVETGRSLWTLMLVGGVFGVVGCAGYWWLGDESMRSPLRGIARRVGRGSRGAFAAKD